ncbi:MAG: hypothetical protein CMC78_00870 [Flavobacteriaceae bacterium]|nr:hypothetical protein [Flavobacteriaceae bacterium]|tara:strand:+ start:2079 stop:2732 length:654 start_codon:yes stop_codon:yes gene_type:complete
MSQKTKKYFVLCILFIFPIVIYLFFASGKNNFALLPVLTENVNEIKNFKTLSGAKIQLEDKISILGFWGEDLSEKKGDALNLNQKIYKRFYQFNDFQFVMVLENGQQDQVNILKEELQEGVGTDLVKWRFVFGSPDEIQDLFDSLRTNLNLSQGKSSPYVFIIDKEVNLRGRDDDEDVGTLYGFNSQSVAEINNKMVDDVKVILAEYRRAWKKYNHN